MNPGMERNVVFRDVFQYMLSLITRIYVLTICHWNNTNVAEYKSVLRTAWKYRLQVTFIATSALEKGSRPPRGLRVLVEAEASRL